MLTSSFAWRSVSFCAAICALSSLPQLPSLADSSHQPKQALLTHCSHCDARPDQAARQKLPVLAGQNKQDVLLALQSNNHLAQAGKMPQGAKGLAE